MKALGLWGQYMVYFVLLCIAIDVLYIYLFNLISKSHGGNDDD